MKTNQVMSVNEAREVLQSFNPGSALRDVIRGNEVLDDRDDGVVSETPQVPTAPRDVDEYYDQVIPLGYPGDDGDR